MLSLDDCSRMELKRLARFATPRQIAEAKARIAREAAARENSERLLLSAESVAACRAVRDHFERFGADESYRRLFEAAKRAASRSAAADLRWRRYEAAAQRLERAARKLEGER
jgi:hypothetical protein